VPLEADDRLSEQVLIPVDRDSPEPKFPDDGGFELRPAERALAAHTLGVDAGFAGVDHGCAP
jgi:hypothetical protein